MTQKQYMIIIAYFKMPSFS